MGGEGRLSRDALRGWQLDETRQQLDVPHSGRRNPLFRT